MESKRSEEELKAREKKINVSNNNNKNHPPLPKSSKQWTLTYVFAKLWLIILLRGNYFYRFIHSFIYLLTYLVNVFTEHLLCIRYLIIPQELNDYSAFKKCPDWGLGDWAGAGKTDWEANNYKTERLRRWWNHRRSGRLWPHEESFEEGVEFSMSKGGQGHLGEIER